MLPPPTGVDLLRVKEQSVSLLMTVERWAVRLGFMILTKSIVHEIHENHETKQINLA
jgi:hypothetical protein